MSLRPSSAPSRGPALTHVLACCAFAACAALSCGGLAADGGEPEPTGLGGVDPDGNEPEVVRPMRETCEDNPLLAGCPTAGTGDSSPPPPDAPIGRDVDPDAERFEIVAAQNVLASYCGPCHGAALTEAQASASINYINDWDQLIAAGLVQRCSPRRSRIIQLMRTGSMPPSRSGLASVPEADIEVVENAIRVGCNIP